MFHLVLVGCLEGPLVSFSLGWWKLRKLGRSILACLLANFRRNQLGQHPGPLESEFLGWGD